MKILVVEDETKTGTYLKQGLVEAGFVVDLAINGLDGLHLALTEAYDLAFLDVMLPKLDGWGVLAALRPANRTPVLMLTARDAVPDRIKGLNAGADDYLTKPFDIDELLARLRALIRRSAGQTHPTLTIGELVLDTAARRACVAGAEIVLTAREYSLLEYLALHRGEVVSRTTLYEHLFDEDDDSLSNLLDVHVSNLRKKLGHDLIVTRRGLGYCIA